VILGTSFLVWGGEEGEKAKEDPKHVSERAHRGTGIGAGSSNPRTHSKDLNIWTLIPS